MSISLANQHIQTAIEHNNKEIARLQRQNQKLQGALETPATPALASSRKAPAPASTPAPAKPAKPPVPAKTKDYVGAVLPLFESGGDVSADAILQRLNKVPGYEGVGRKSLDAVLAMEVRRPQPRIAKGTGASMYRATDHAFESPRPAVEHEAATTVAAR